MTLIKNLIDVETMTFEEYVDRALSYERIPRSLIRASVYFVSRLMKEEGEDVIGYHSQLRIYDVVDRAVMFNESDYIRIYDDYADDIDKEVEQDSDTLGLTLDELSGLSENADDRAKKAEIAIFSVVLTVLKDFGNDVDTLVD